MAEYKIVYAVIQRGPRRNHWLRVGIAFVNRDGSLNVRLDALPVSGELQIRDPPRGDAGEPAPELSDDRKPGE
mgnify:CR=1 FL=1